MTSAVFFLAVASQAKFSLANKISKSLENMQNIYTLVLSTSKKHANEYLEKLFGNFHLLLTIRSCIPTQTFASCEQH